jgi:hypothetical protein
MFTNIALRKNNISTVSLNRRLKYKHTARPVIYLTTDRIKARNICCNISTKELLDIVEYNSYILTKGVLLFTFFYCSLNWLHYRDMRKRDEEEK